MADRVLILGGTREAAELAAKLVANGRDVTTSLAGRTKEPRPVEGKVRIGGFGGADGLARHLSEAGFDRMIDATHPFAVNITRNAVMAAEAAGIPLETFQRPPWTAEAGDCWQNVAGIDEAVAAIPGGSRVLLALGSQHLAPFAARDDVHYVVRMVDAPENRLPFASCTLVLGRPSTDPQVEARLLTDKRIDIIVCRNSGGSGAFAKLLAARSLALPVIMIARPTAI